MADVVRKIISANDVKNGTAVVGAQPTGVFDTETPDITAPTDITGTDAKYDAKFNKAYYEYNT
jgi:hypothetical protein